MSKVFSQVKGLHPKRSRFNVGYAKAYDCDMGQLIPTMVKYMVPGDIFRFSQEIVVRIPEPLKAPAMVDMNAHTSVFFVPLRILFGSMVTQSGDPDSFKEWEVNDHDFEKFLTGGRSGKDNSVSLPLWIPTGSTVVNDNWNGIEPPSPGDPDNGSNKNWVNVSVEDNGKYSLWDYLENPTGVIPVGAYPLDFWKRAYNLIWNEWYRDENVMPPVDVANSDIVLNCCWKKDYFTSMLPWPQRGNPIGIPISGNTSVSLNVPAVAPVVYSAGYTAQEHQLAVVDSSKLGYHEGESDDRLYDGSAATSLFAPIVADLTGITGTADLSLAATFTVNDLRLAFQVQRWQELMARTGSRLVEYLKANYGCSPTDDTLQRPMFVGGYKSPVIISEVLQTSTGDNGVGSLAGHGLAADSNFVCKFRANEFGVLMALTTIRPKAMYHQGIDAENLYRSRYDLYNPAFVSLGEQGVKIAELYAQNSGNVDASGDPVIIGFQGRYNELRASHDKICGGLRDQLSYWIMKRSFGTAPELNGQFLKCNPTKDIFVVQDEPSFVVMVNNKISAYRPLPVFATPGYLDHLYGE